MARKKVECALRDWSEVDEELSGLCDLRAEEDAAEAEMNRALTAIRNQFKPQLDEVREARAWSEAQIELFCIEHRADFAKSKTRELTHGKVSFRLGTPSCVLLNRKWTWLTVVDALKGAMNVVLRRCVRTKEDELERLLRDQGAKLADADKHAVKEVIAVHERAIRRLGYTVAGKQINLRTGKTAYIFRPRAVVTTSKNVEGSKSDPDVGAKRKPADSVGLPRVGSRFRILRPVAMWTEPKAPPIWEDRKKLFAGYALKGGEIEIVDRRGIWDPWVRIRFYYNGTVLGDPKWIRLDDVNGMLKDGPVWENVVQ